MQIDLRGKTAIVTGAGRGIGRVVAETLAAEGVNVVVTDIRQELLAETAARWSDKAWPGLQLLCDVRDAGQCNAVAEQSLVAFGRIDILVNNAGIARGNRIATLSDTDWDDSLDINLSGVMRMCRAVIPAMQRQRAGRILNAASFAAIVPSIGGAAYSAAKAGVVSLTRVLAGELGPYGVTVNCYAPGMIPTEMNHFAERAPDDQQRLLDTLTLRRWGVPQDVADLVCFLASDRAGYITGTTIDISGGKLATQMPWAAHRDA